MPNLKDIKTRIASVENTKKITRAMKMVAAAKVKKAENSVKSARPFSETLMESFRNLLTALGDKISDNGESKIAIENYPILLKKRDIKSVGLLVITSNKGLAGAYNANVVRNVSAEIDELISKGITPKLFLVGQKGASALKRKIEENNLEVINTYIDVINEITAAGAERIAYDLAQNYVDENIDSIEVFTTKFKNMMSYSAQKWELLPITVEEDNTPEIDPLMTFEPDEGKILQKIVPLYITNTIYQALLEAQASELASRMTAMSAASNNAEEMIRTLTIDYNKARQWAITQEIIEVASGAEAIKG